MYGKADGGIDGDLHIHCYRADYPPGLACSAQQLECGDFEMGALYDSGKERHLEAWP